MKKSPLWLGVLAALAAQTVLLPSVSVAREIDSKIHTQELLNKADLVFAGKVIDIQYKDSTDGTPHTFVTYEIGNVIAGRPDGDKVTLRFMGGRQQKGEVIRYLTVSEAPDFQVGDSDVLFVSNNEKSICPIVDCSKGRFRNLDGVLANEDGIAVIQDEKTRELLLSGKAINPVTGLVIDFAKGMSDPLRDTSEPEPEVSKGELVKVDEFVARVQTQGKETPRFRDSTPEFRTALIEKEFRAPQMLPVEPRDVTPSLQFIKTPITSTVDFDRWEEEAVSKNGGNPVIN